MPKSDAKPDIKQLGKLLQRHRHAVGLSLDQLAGATGINKSSIHRIEQGQFEAPSPQTLQRIAAALGTEVEDYFALAGYFTPHGLPGLAPYLRAKYGASPELASQVEDYFAWLREKEDRDVPEEPRTNQH
jgi:transcriptional regulator with XRE-family HTH domain